MKIAITGHRGLPTDTSSLIDQAIRAELAEFDPSHLVGISCLADGADQIFARAILDAGGTLAVIVPAREYRAGLPEEAHPSYDALFAQATSIHQLDRIESTSDAHMEASKAMLADADLLLAVWDGEPARGYGGTADIVDVAREHGVPVTVVWPTGAHRDEPAQAL